MPGHGDLLAISEQILLKDFRILLSLKGYFESEYLLVYYVSN